jgi:enoyl-CoA hydratase/carnithine racemase
MRNEIIDLLDDTSKKAHIRAIILTGDDAGRAFCAGADLSGGGLGSTADDNPAQMPGDIPEGRPINGSTWRDGGGMCGLALMRCTKPVIAAINGAAVGVGMTLPLACDISIAAEDATVGFVFGKRGLTMECLSSTFLQRAVGYKKAMELVLTGRTFKVQC